MTAAERDDIDAAIDHELPDRGLNTNPDRFESPTSPAMEIAIDIAKRGLPLVPVGMIIGALFAELPGALSVAYGMALVILNLLLSAALLNWAAKISFGMVAGVALGGYAMRLGLIFVAFWLVKDMSWVAIVPLGITIIITHLGLLGWEMRHVSATMAHPGLKPKKSRKGPRPVAAGCR